MWTIIYDCLSLMSILIGMRIGAQYVFLEPEVKNPRLFYGASFFLILAVRIFGGEDAALFLPLMLAGISISISRKKRKIRGFFLFIPIMGISLGILLPILSFPEMLIPFSEHQLDLYNKCVDFFICVLLILFWWKGKTWRDKFRIEMQYRSLQKWESRLLITVGLLMWVVSGFFPDTGMIIHLQQREKFYIICACVIALVLTVTVIILVSQGNKSAYYYGVAELNKQYLDAQTRHFQAYQKAQVETRRIRHDMNNHIMCLSHLVNTNDFQGVKDYLNKLNVMVAQTSRELQCGNGLVDAICNEKYHWAKQQGIRFELEGRLPEKLSIDAVDLCTLFANALDNAIEAMQQVEESCRVLSLNMNIKENILFLQFKNAVKDNSGTGFIGRTTKKNQVDHGFGLKNIETVVKRYHGEMHAGVEEEKSSLYFILDIMIFLT